MRDLAGSTRQVKWATTIYQNFQGRFNAELPDISSAEFWIRHRNVQTLEELHQQAQAYAQEPVSNNPFTMCYPRYKREQAIEVLRTLPERIAVLDTETTGINKKGEVCELVIVEYPSRRMLFNSLIQPHDERGKHNVRAMEKNGITWDELLNAPTLHDVWTSMLTILVGYHLSAFNADFDIPMLRYSIRKWGISAPRLQATCLMKLATVLAEMDYYLSLEEACTLFDVDRTPYGDTHRALADTLATCELLQKLQQHSKG